MRRLFVERPLDAGVTVTLDGAAARRVASVLRLRAGDEMTLFDGTGVEARAALTSVSPSRVEARVVSVAPGLPEPAVRVTLYQSVVKGERFDWLVEKGTELGVARFVPLLSRRAVARPGEGGKLERWRRIAIEAAEQCGRAVVPEVSAPVSLEEALTSLEGPALLPYEGERAAGIAQALRSAAGGGRPASLALIIGPEGGFEPDEVRLALAAGAQPVSLGPRILRSETAGIVAAALTLAELGALDAPG